MLFIILNIPILLLAISLSRLFRLRRKNSLKKDALLQELGVTDKRQKRIVGFFHPYCNAGGGGERVLWTAVALFQRTEPDVISVVYTGDTDATKEEIIRKVKSRFDIELDPTSLHFIFLHKRNLVADTTWPRFTLLGQSTGSMILAWEAMSVLIPDLYIEDALDTMGYAFTFHVVKLLGGIPIGAYVHYPTISTDMLARVRTRQSTYANATTISSSAALSTGKLLYYRIFMHMYAQALRRAGFVMVNSSWTKNHVDSILQHKDLLFDTLHLISPLALLDFVYPPSPPRSARIVYPPCDTREMVKFPLGHREHIILSIAQFRPEKNHKLQVEAFAELLSTSPKYRENGSVRLVLLGGSRNAEDAARVEQLRSLAKELKVDQHVQFVVNAEYSEMLDWLSRASIGLSTMIDEHFGINVVEYMAAGVIPVTHASGGPLNDIVVPFNGLPTGFHATTAQTYAATFDKVFSLAEEEEIALRSRTRIWAVQRFSQEEFEKGWNESGWREELR
ncbi:mannosyltransferase [Irpex rosettiformis]|uniref:Mannosyltransferase n=1 Tax=Irpex rosettiformis TaxID=378272 RepID=A0ACB8U306_9APHY|nr:mannosyltransferase [Irpex rosettiformis]